MTTQREKVIDHMKEHYPNTYAHFSEYGKHDNKATFKRIDESIKDSKKHHAGIDMSGLTSLLSSIKLERIVLGELDINEASLYDYQWEKVQEMLDNGIQRDTSCEDFYKKRNH